jgi:hypothetical protein
MDMKRLGKCGREILRRLYGPVVEQGIWRVRNDQELRELYKDLDIIVDIVILDYRHCVLGFDVLEVMGFCVLITCVLCAVNSCSFVYLGVYF